MAKVKGRKKLNKAITKLVKPFGISKAKVGNDFAYYFNDEHIEFQITCGDWSDQMFDKFLLSKFGIECPYPFVISILHEIGHHITFEELTTAEINKSYKAKDRLAKTFPKATGKKKEALEFEYFNLPDELAATTWAVDYFSHHREECDEMYKKACKALRKFYKKNGIAGE